MCDPVKETEREGGARRIATIEISGHLLAQVLHLPPGTEIVGCCDGTFHLGCGLGSILLKVEQADLKPVRPGYVIPRANPTWKKQDEIIFCGWGQ